jgi:hypothetical protein
MSYNSRFAQELAEIAAASLGVAPSDEAFIFLDATTGLLSATINTGAAQPLALLGNGTTLAANSFLFGSSAGNVQSTSAATNGQLLIGSTGADPVKASLTAGTGITITPGAGSITIASTASGTVGPGTTNRIAKFTAATTIGDSNVSDDGTTVTVLSSGAANPVLFVRGAAAQTGDLQRWQDSTPSTLASVSSDGTILSTSGFTGTLGTITTDKRVISGTATWNAGGVTFYGGFINITDTASGANSRLLSIQLAGVEKLYVDKSGNTVIDGNLTVNGTTTTINSTVVNIADRVIHMNYAPAGTVPVPTQICGFEVERGSIASVYRDGAGMFWIEGSTLFRVAFNTAADDTNLGANVGLTAGTITSDIGTITAAQNSYAAVATWNNGAVTFTAADINITDTASAAASRLLALRVGGADRMIVTKDGAITSATLTANAFIYSATGSVITSTAAPTDGQLLIGSTGAAPVVATLTAGTGISITNGAGSITIALSTPVSIANGGTNSTTALNNNRIMVSSGGAIVEAAALTNGQLLIGSTGAAPVAATLTAGTGISITNGAGSITIASTASGTVGPGTTNRIAKFTAATTIGDSNISDNGTTITALSSGAANPVLAVQGAAAQTGDLQRWQDNTATVLSSITAAGIFNSTTFTASSFAFVNASQNLVTTAAPTNGQLLIGSTGANPVVAALTAGTGISITNGAGSITIALSTPVSIANGGTNSTTALNNNRIMVSSGGAIVEAAALTNGQLLIGSTGAAPVAAAITAGLNMVVTNGAGSISLASLSNTTNQTANYSASATDTAIYVANPGGGTVTITLPSAVTAGAGKIYVIKRTNAGGGAANRVDITSATNIDGATTQSLNTQYSSITVQSDGTVWNII